MNILTKDDTMYVYRNIEYMLRAIDNPCQRMLMADYAFVKKDRYYCVVKDRSGIFDECQIDIKTVLRIIDSVLSNPETENKD